MGLDKTKPTLIGNSLERNYKAIPETTIRKKTLRNDIPRDRGVAQQYHSVEVVHGNFEVNRISGLEEMVMPQFDPQSEKNIKTLVAKAQEKARTFLQGVRDAGINAKIIDGSRTFEEQDALFAIGRTKPGHVVTNARGGFSNHNFGVAWDIGIF